MKSFSIVFFVVFAIAFFSWNNADKWSVADNQFLGSRNPANILKSIKKTVTSAKNFTGKGIGKNPGAEAKEKIAELKDKLKLKEAELRMKVAEKEKELKLKVAAAKGNGDEVIASTPEELRERAMGTPVVEEISTEVVRLNLEIRKLEDSSAAVFEETSEATQVCNLQKSNQDLEEKIRKLLADKEDMLRVIVEMERTDYVPARVSRVPETRDFFSEHMSRFNRFSFMDRIENFERPMSFPIYRSMARASEFEYNFPREEFRFNQANRFNEDRFYARVPDYSNRFESEYSFLRPQSILDYDMRDDLRTSLYDSRFYNQR